MQDLELVKMWRITDVKCLCRNGIFISSPSKGQKEWKTQRMGGIEWQTFSGHDAAMTLKLLAAAVTCTRSTEDWECEHFTRAKGESTAHPPGSVGSHGYGGLWCPFLQGRGH